MRRTRQQGINRVIEAILAWDRPYGCGVRDVAEATGYSVGQVSRLLGFARARGLVTWVEGKARTLEVL